METDFGDDLSYLSAYLTSRTVGKGIEIIIRIINEEAGAYYSGQKSVEDAAGLIQNRIQVYVNENMR